MGLALGGCETAPEGARADARLDQALRSHVRNILVIYAENRSFSNLYGNFPGVRHPLSAVPASLYAQLDRDGRTQLARLPKIWGGLVPRPPNVGGRHFETTHNQHASPPTTPL